MSRITPEPDKPPLFDQMQEAPCNPQLTSQAANTSARPRKGTLRRKVYDFIDSRGLYGATDEEIQKGLDMPGDTQRPRRYELVAAGVVVDSGFRRKTTNGKEAIAWITHN